MMVDFNEFWQQYPRKIARRYAEKCWRRLTEEEKKKAVSALPAHLKWWAREGRDWGYVPHASTWLNQARWEDVIEDGNNGNEHWWETTEGTMERGRKIGISSRPGENMNDYRARLKRA